MIDILNQLEIFTVEALKIQNPLDLYFKISNLRGELQNAKMYDMCNAIIYSARTDSNMHWSEWSKIRLKKHKKNAIREIIEDLVKENQEVFNKDEILNTLNQAELLEIE